VDIETTNLRANVGHVLAVCAVPLNSDEVKVFRLDDKRYRMHKAYDDQKLVIAVREYLEDAFCWVTWNGKMFDIPFLNSRLMLKGQDTLRQRMHIDLMYYARRPNLQLTSSRLAAVAKAFKLSEQKDEFDYEPWQMAEHLEKLGMDYVVEHCCKDVRVLKEAFKVLAPFIRNIHV
jgi:uncharacterized protein YprB with RNaseH-like and TPR domain